jgi:hypothetical protein
MPHWSDAINTAGMFDIDGCRAFKRLQDPVPVPWDSESTWHITMETDSAIEHECYYASNEIDWQDMLQRYGEHLQEEPTQRGHLLVDVKKHVLAERDYVMHNREGHYTCVAACDKLVMSFATYRDQKRLVFEDSYQVRTIEDDAHYVTHYDPHMEMTPEGKATVHKIVEYIKSLHPDWEVTMPKS